MHEIDHCYRAVNVANKIQERKELIKQLHMRGPQLLIRDEGSSFNWRMGAIKFWCPISALVKVLEDEIVGLQAELKEVLNHS